MKKILFLLLFPIVVLAQKDSVSSVKKSNISVVSADKMNLVYRGISNPISIAVNNAKSYTISGDGVIFQKGKYVLKPGVGLETKVIVEIENFDGSKIKEEHVFRIKGLPKPIGTLNDEYSTNGSALIFSKEELKGSKVGIKFIDFLFNFDPIVTQFNFSIVGKKAIIVEGNKFNNEVIMIIKKAKKRDYLIISEIKTNYMSNDALHTAPRPISFQVID